jgi:Cu+-exporting ATPase
VLRPAGALEHVSEHPIAEAIATGAAERVGELPEVEGFQNHEGVGVQGVVDGHAVVVGRERLPAEWSVHLDDDHDLAETKRTAEQRGHTAVLVS